MALKFEQIFTIFVNGTALLDQGFWVFFHLVLKKPITKFGVNLLSYVTNKMYFFYLKY